MNCHQACLVLSCISWRKVEVNIFMTRQPALIFRLMGFEVVKRYMDFLVGIFQNHFVHKVQESTVPAAFVMAGFHLAGNNVQGRRQSSGSIALVLVTEASNRPAV